MQRCAHIDLDIYYHSKYAMTRTKAKKPEIYRDFMGEGFFPDANKITKYQESSNYWIFKTGKKVYKIKKKITGKSAIALDEIFCREIVASLVLHSPDLEAELFYVHKENNHFLVDRHNKKGASYYGVAMNQLSDRYFFDAIIGKGKATNGMIQLVAGFLAHFHELVPKTSAKEDGTPEQLGAILQDLFYQSKKYLGVTMSQVVIDMVLHPLERFLVDNRKLFLRRIRKGYIRKIHGCFVPRKIHICEEKLNVLSRSDDLLKRRFADVASDVADLTVELDQAGERGLAESLVKAYSGIGNDKELRLILPFYRAMKCLSLGNRHSVAMEGVAKRQVSHHRQRAIQYYEQTIDIARTL